jgi:hypothetical protein
MTRAVGIYACLVEAFTAGIAIGTLAFAGPSSQFLGQRERDCVLKLARRAKSKRLVAHYLLSRLISLGVYA